MKSLSLISLGCPKNTVDSESLLRALGRRGVRSVSDPAEADIVAVNTCGFIEDAKRESIEEILRLAELRSNGRKLVVFGCLAQRYREELLGEIPEIDAIFGLGEEERIIEYCAGGGAGAGVDVEGALSGPSRYLKVSEGCSRRCTYCVIPAIRGPHRSRRPDEILREAESYVGSGSRELVLVAQDITAYGRELKGYGLPELLREMVSIGGDFWVRLLYLHPGGIDDELLDVIAAEEKICNYIDLPLQHSEDRVLRAMGRAGGTRKQYLKLLGRIRKSVAGVAIRTSFIVGFPGETEHDFHGLVDFVEEAGFERLGVFKYSREEGTRAASMGAQVPEDVKQRRWDELMGLQADISLQKNRSLLGSTLRALVDGVDEGGRALGRIYSQAPDIDGHTVIAGDVQRGSFADVRITGASDYDLEGEPLL